MLKRCQNLATAYEVGRILTFVSLLTLSGKLLLFGPSYYVASSTWSAMNGEMNASPICIVNFYYVYWLFHLTPCHFISLETTVPPPPLFTRGLALPLFSSPPAATVSCLRRWRNGRARKANDSGGGKGEAFLGEPWGKIRWSSVEQRGRRSSGRWRIRPDRRGNNCASTRFEPTALRMRSRCILCALHWCMLIRVIIGPVLTCTVSCAKEAREEEIRAIPSGGSREKKGNKAWLWDTVWWKGDKKQWLLLQ